MRTDFPFNWYEWVNSDLPTIRPKKDKMLTRNDARPLGRESRSVPPSVASLCSTVSSVLLVIAGNVILTSFGKQSFDGFLRYKKLKKRRNKRKLQANCDLANRRRQIQTIQQIFQQIAIWQTARIPYESYFALVAV